MQSWFMNTTLVLSIFAMILQVTAADPPFNFSTASLTSTSEGGVSYTGGSAASAIFSNAFHEATPLLNFGRFSMLSSVALIDSRFLQSTKYLKPILVCHCILLKKRWCFILSRLNPRVLYYILRYFLNQMYIPCCNKFVVGRKELSTPVNFAVL